MKRLFFLLLMVITLSPSFADGGKKKKKEEKQNVEQLSETRPVEPLNRERWIERDGRNYVIVTRTTISHDDYQRLKNINK
jgi:hypothetical protein